MFYRSLIETPLGTMVAVADEQRLYYLKFADQDSEIEIKRLVALCDQTIESGSCSPIISIATELQSYFNGNLGVFTTSVRLIGTPFQSIVWQKLLEIPYGTTQSYREQATSMGNEKACRAVAGANGANLIAIVIPCHRIINNDGKLGGYAGGLARKQWLLEHERRHHHIVSL